jgi:hypothetical protein
MGRRVKDSPYRTLSRIELAKIFGVTNKQVGVWVREGCPSNSDDTLNTEAVFRWYVQREVDRISKGGLKDEKLKLECQRLEAQIAKINDTTIDRTFHEQVLVSRASSLRTFFEKTAMSAATDFVGLSLDQSRVKLLALFRRAMGEYADSLENFSSLKKSEAQNAN